ATATRWRGAAGSTTSRARTASWRSRCRWLAATTARSPGSSCASGGRTAAWPPCASPTAITTPPPPPVSVIPPPRRPRRGTPATAIARAAWRFADATCVSLDGGFEPGKIYELVYRSERPPLVGLGLVAVRDTAAWLRFATTADGNPCASELERAYVLGVSQT